MQDWSQKKSVWCYELQLRRVHVTWIWDQAPKRNHQAPAGEGSLLVTQSPTQPPPKEAGVVLQRRGLLPFPVGATSLQWIHIQFLGAQNSSSVMENSWNMKELYICCLLIWLKTAITLSPTLQHTPPFSGLRKFLVETASTVCLAVPSPRFFR